MKHIVKKAIVIGAIAVAVVVFSSVFVFDPFHFGLSLFKHELKIDKTSNVISQIKKISQFTTACFYEEKVLRHDKYKQIEKKVYTQKMTAIDRAKGLIGVADKPEYTTVADSSINGTIVFIVKTKVLAGFNLGKISENDLRISGDTLSVKLPEAEIFDIIVNPTDWEIFHRDGGWEDSELRAIQANAKEEIRKDALQYGLIDKATSFGHESLASLFKSFGFSEVIIQ